MMATRNVGWAVALMALWSASGSPSLAEQNHSFSTVIAEVQPKVVKIYGAGGLRGLEAYQSGFLISAEGHVLTAHSYVLDTEFVRVVLNDGRAFSAERLGIDPRLEIAVLKIDVTNVPHFDLADDVTLGAGDRVLAYANIFKVAQGDEAASVLHGVVAAVNELSARQGAFETVYQGSVYVLDAMTNNPGAAGGALTDRRGRLAAVLGKELRNSRNSTWLNYAIPVEHVRPAVADIIAGKSRRSAAREQRSKPDRPHTLTGLGMLLVPDVLAATPPFVDRVLPDSAAARAGVRPDDLVLFVNQQVTSSVKSVVEELSWVDRIDNVEMTIQRGQRLINIELK